MTQSLPTALDQLLIKQIQENGVALPNRQSLNFLGGTLADNPTNNSTDYTPPTGFSAPTPTEGAIMQAHSGAWGTLPVGSAGQRIISNGTDPVYSSGGWLTALDLDFTAQVNQTIGTNGSYTIGGLTWTKGNHANETTSLALTNGTGLVFSPGATGGYPGSASGSGSSSRTLPYIWTPLSGILPAGFDFATGLRVWVYVSADNLASQHCFSCVAIDDNGATLQDGYAMARGYCLSASVAELAAWSICASNNLMTTATAFTTQTMGNSNRVNLLEIPALGDFRVRGSVGTYGPPWPATSALQFTAAGSPQEACYAMPTTCTPSSFGLLLGAGGNGNTSSGSITIARVRVDYKL